MQRLFCCTCVPVSATNTMVWCVRGSATCISCLKCRYSAHPAYSMISTIASCETMVKLCSCFAMRACAQFNPSFTLSMTASFGDMPYCRDMRGLSQVVCIKLEQPRSMLQKHQCLCPCCIRVGMDHPRIGWACMERERRACCHRQQDGAPG